MRETAYAKINLALHVRARRDDGYHDIETVFAFCEDGDVLTVEHVTMPGHSDDSELTLLCTGFTTELENSEENLVMRAASALWSLCRQRYGVAIKLDKRLPIAAGLGGGSADAAAALRLLRRAWKLQIGDEALHQIAVGLGADVPACLSSRAARGEGRGDVLTPMFDNDFTGTPVLLVNPGIPLATAAVFAAWDGEDRGPLLDWRDGRNDLEPAAIALIPEIAEVLAAFEGAEVARMSGSGATCFGLYADAAARDAEADRIAALHPDWWLLRTRLR